MDLLYFATSLQNELSEEKFGLVLNFPTTPNTPTVIPYPLSKKCIHQNNYKKRPGSTWITSG